MTLRDEMIENLKARLDPSVRVYGGPATALPVHWQDYLGDHEVERRFALRQELAALEPYLPRTMAGLEAVALDAFMAETDSHGIIRVITRQIAGALYGTFSELPVSMAPLEAEIWTTFAERAPQALTWMYRSRMNGLTDFYGFAGFKTSRHLTTMAEEVDTYGEAPWYAEFAASHDTNSIVEVLATGGGAYLLLDLSRDQSKSADPDGLLVYMNEGTSPETVSFFGYLDTFMEIGLSGR